MIDEEKLRGLLVELLQSFLTPIFERLEYLVQGESQAQFERGVRTVLNSQDIAWYPAAQQDRIVEWIAEPVIHETVAQVRVAQPAAPTAQDLPPVDTRGLNETAAMFPQTHERTFGAHTPTPEIVVGGPLHASGTGLLRPQAPAPAPQPQLPRAAVDGISPEVLRAAQLLLARSGVPGYPGANGSLHQAPQSPANVPVGNIVAETLRRFGRT